MTPREAELQGPSEQLQESQEQDADDRRSRHRFSLRLAVRCRRIGARFLLDRILVGESLNISSKGLLFTTSEAFRPGQFVEAFIDWPIRLQDGVRLALVVQGAVVRSSGNHAAMHIEKYQFRTCAAAGVAIR
jgi:hypothetical protein